MGRCCVYHCLLWDKAFHAEKTKNPSGGFVFSGTSPISCSCVRSHCKQACTPGHELVCGADANPFFGWDVSELISATNLQINPEDWRTAGGRLLCFACCLFRQFVSAHRPPEFSNLLCPSVFSCLLTKIFGAGAVFLFFYFLARAAQLGACSSATHSDKGRLKDKDTA